MTDTRICKECGVTKPLTEFLWRSELNTYRHRCLECERKRTKRNYLKYHDYYKKRDSTVTEKTIARSKLRSAVARGAVKRKPCEVCGAVKAQAHHDDYSKPLEVRFLCKKHHAQHHRKLKVTPPSKPLADK